MTYCELNPSSEGGRRILASGIPMRGHTQPR